MRAEAPGVVAADMLQLEGGATVIQTAHHCFQALKNHFATEAWASKHARAKISHFEVLWAGKSRSPGPTIERARHKQNHDTPKDIQTHYAFHIQHTGFVGKQRHACWCLPCVASVLAGPAEGTKRVPDFRPGCFHYRIPGCRGAEGRTDDIFAMNVHDSRCQPKPGALLTARDDKICHAGISLAQKLQPGDLCLLEGVVPQELYLAKAVAIEDADSEATPCVGTHGERTILKVNGHKFRQNQKMVAVVYFEEDGAGYTQDEATGQWYRTLTLREDSPAKRVHATEVRARHPQVVETHRDGHSTTVKISRNEEARVLQTCR